MGAARGDGDLGERLGAMEIVETRILALYADGKTDMSLAYTDRDQDGDHLVGFTNVATDDDLIFDPPPLTLSSALSVGERSETTGTLGSSRYR